MKSTSTDPASVRYEVSPARLVVDELSISSPTVLAEAHHWSTGRRGPAVDDARLVGCDLAAFVNVALEVGTRAIVAADGVSESADLRALVQELGQRAERVTSEAISETRTATGRTTEAMRHLEQQARTMLVDTATQMRLAIQEAVAGGVRSLRSEVDSLLVGEKSSLAVAAGAAVATAGHNLELAIDGRVTAAIDRVVSKFDVRDPTSPLGHLSVELSDRHEALANRFEVSSKELSGRIEQLNLTVATANAAARATSVVASRTPLKGVTYQEKVDATIAIIAAALGDEYEQTGTRAGARAYCKKGDGVLTVVDANGTPEAAARVVIETSTTDSGRRDWNKYLEDAEANRRAHASLGIVPSAVHVPGGDPIRIFGPRRFVIAFDPDRDELPWLRSVLLLLRVQAVLNAARHGGGDVAVAAERVVNAQRQLEQMAVLARLAGTTRANADKIASGLTDLQSQLSVALGEVARALAGATAHSAVASPDPQAN